MQSEHIVAIERMEKKHPGKHSFYLQVPVAFKVERRVDILLGV